MRNVLSLIISGFILCGCLAPEEPNADLAGDSSDNNVPTITGIPASATKFDEAYEFVPTADDADGDTLTFEVQNKPHWASFNSTTGKLSGMPTQADIGEYRDIVITVSDGSSNASLTAFSVAVTQTAPGNVTLTWSAPTQYSDGSPLTDLAGFKIYYRKNSGFFNAAIELNDPGLTTYVVDQLSPATYHFVATAVNSSGVESWYSTEVARTVN